MKRLHKSIYNNMLLLNSYAMVKLNMYPILAMDHQRLIQRSPI
jgi:hypothetical protein